MKELIKYIVQALVDNPEQVELNEISGGNTTVFELRVAKKDLGKVIGKGGRTANSLRTLVRAAGAKEQKSIWVDINKISESEPEAMDG